MLTAYLLQHPRTDICNLTSIKGGAYLIDNWKKFYKLYVNDVNEGAKHYLQMVLGAETVFMFHLEIDDTSDVKPIISELERVVYDTFDMKDLPEIISDVNMYNERKYHIYVRDVYVTKPTAKALVSMISSKLTLLGVKCDLDDNYSGLRLYASYKWNNGHQKSVYRTTGEVTLEDMLTRHLLTDQEPTKTVQKLSIAPREKGIQIEEIIGPDGEDYAPEIVNLGTTFHEGTGKVKKMERHGNIITVIFFRKRRGYCKLCEKTHDHDNCSYVTVHIDNLQIVVFAGCFKSQKKEKIHTFGDEEPPILDVPEERKRLADYYGMPVSLLLDDDKFQKYNSEHARLAFIHLTQQTPKRKFILEALTSLGFKIEDGKFVLKDKMIHNVQRYSPSLLQLRSLFKVYKLPTTVNGIVSLIDRLSTKYMMIHIAVKEDRYVLRCQYRELFSLRSNLP